jgi:hydroxypyruvate reductase
MDLLVLLERCFRQSVAAVDPRRVVGHTLEGRLAAGDGDFVVLALGKAAIGMAWGVADATDRPLRGVIVGDHEGEVPDGLRLYVGGHPLPTAASLAGGTALLDAAASARPSDLVVCLVSGGGSALAEALVPGVALDDVRATTDLLLRCGATIDEMNAVRTSLSRIKGGGLAAAVGAARSVTLVMSDVVGDRLDVIASGPMVAADGVADRAHDVLARHGLIDVVPDSVASVIRVGNELPRATCGDIEVIASHRTVAAAAADAVRAEGLTAAILDTELMGEADATARAVLGVDHPAHVHVYAGETTVVVHGDGRGGRNHEAALAAAIALDGTEGRAFLAAGTDGVDGFAGGAGAVVDGTTNATARRLGLDAADFLTRNDSGGFFDQVPGRIDTGPTGTNVGDLWMVARL